MTVLEFFKQQYGNIASVIGLLVSVVGFVATIGNVRKARRAAEEARLAAREVVSRIKSQLISNEIEASIRLIREIDKLCRSRQWEEVADICDEARARLAQLPQDDRLSDDDKQLIESSIKSIGSLMRHAQPEKIGDAKGLSTSRAKELHEIITALGRIYGRLQTVTLEI